jgi:hypothetical protein
MTAVHVTSIAEGNDETTGTDEVMGESPQAAPVDRCG